MAGALLYQILHWVKYAKATIPGVSGHWIANDRTWWMREAQLSSGQYDRSMRKLEGWNLIERRQWWFGRRNILFVRPSELAFDLYPVCTTWAAAYEFSQEHIVGSDSLSFTNMVNFNGDAGSVELTSSKTMNSKDKDNLLGNKHNSLQSALSASPKCGKEDAFVSKRVSGKKNGSFTDEVCCGVKHQYPTSKSVAAVWTAAMKECFSEKSAVVTAKERGYISEMVEGLHSVYGPEGIEDLTSRAEDIVDFAVRNWSLLDPAYASLNLSYLTEHLSDAITEWAKSGRPSIASGLATE